MAETHFIENIALAISTQLFHLLKLGGNFIFSYIKMFQHVLYSDMLIVFSPYPFPPITISSLEAVTKTNGSYNIHSILCSLKNYTSKYLEATNQ